jgi:hypothetical protein
VILLERDTDVLVLNKVSGHEDVRGGGGTLPRILNLDIIIIIIIYLFTAIGFAPGGSSPTLVQTETIKQHYTVAQHNTITHKHKIIRT